MPRRCRGIRGDVGIAPYGRATRVRSYNVSLRRFALPPSQRETRGVPRLRARRGDVGIAPYERSIEVRSCIGRAG